MSTRDLRGTIKIFKSLADENRIRILSKLTAGEKCACDLLDDLSITAPTLSHHMSMLIDAELVESRKEGKWVYYRLSEEGIKRANTLISDFINKK